MTNPLTIQLFCEETLQNVYDNGDELTADCPKCNKGKKHFNINLETGLFNCFRCGFSGNFPQLVRYITGYYPDLDKLEQQYVSELNLEELQNIFTPTESPHIESIPDWTIDTCGITVEGRLPKQARKYLLNRGISVELAEELGFRVGIVGRYGGRILMPVVEKGEVCNFVARSFTNNTRRYTGPHKGEGYVNKSELLWNYDKIQYNTEIVLVEGIFDCIAIMDKYSTVALMGKTISDTQVEKLLVKAKSVVILLDAEFIQSAKKIAEKLLGFVPVKIGLMEKGDPSDSPELAEKAVKQAVDFYEL